MDHGVSSVLLPKINSCFHGLAGLFGSEGLTISGLHPFCETVCDGKDSWGCRQIGKKAHQSVMSTDKSEMSCIEFQSQLPDLIGAGRDVKSHPHVKVCAICSELVRDLYRAAENAKHGRFETES